MIHYHALVGYFRSSVIQKRGLALDHDLDIGRTQTGRNRGIATEILFVPQMAMMEALTRALSGKDWSRRIHEEPSRTMQR